MAELVILGAYLPPAIAEDFHIYRTFFQEVFKEEAAGSSYQGKASLHFKVYSLISGLQFFFAQGRLPLSLLLFYPDLALPLESDLSRLDF